MVNNFVFPTLSHFFLKKKYENNNDCLIEVT